jgi:hypothetical protein
MQEIGGATLPYIERWQTFNRLLTIKRSHGTESIVKDTVSSKIGAKTPLQHWNTLELIIVFFLFLDCFNPIK